MVLKSATVTDLTSSDHRFRQIARVISTQIANGEIARGSRLMSERDLETFIRQKADTIYHLAGTCRMGPDADVDAVVDARLRVRGVDALRVADASIMPEVVNAPTHAACVAIGEKCADLISGR